MARRPQPPQPQPANLSHQQMRAAIPKIDRRLTDLERLDIASIRERTDPRIGTLSNQLDTLLVSIFGAGTIEYERYQYDVTQLDTAPMNLMYPTPLPQVQEGLRRGVERARANLEAIKAGFLEELGDSGEVGVDRVLKAYAGLDLHPAIERAAGALFRDGHYANAVGDAVKALNALVRLNSGVDDRDGSALMESVFNPGKPILRFNDLADESDRNEQKGFMMMFSGAVAGLRNPRAHKIIQDDPERALEFIAFVSLLAKLADEGRK